uniref:Uncharacterized protein n=1 Tax=Anguilla anguilla TaxID=7936 RepID=A0A0E9S5J9_ANGAN
MHFLLRCQVLTDNLENKERVMPLTRLDLLL